MNPYTRARILRYKLEGPTAEELNQVAAPSGEALKNFGQFMDSHPEYNQPHVPSQAGPWGPDELGPAGISMPPDVQQWWSNEKIKAMKPGDLIPKPTFPYRGPDFHPERGDEYPQIRARSGNLAQANPWAGVSG